MLNPRGTTGHCGLIKERVMDAADFERHEQLEATQRWFTVAEPA